jgi:nucleotide-binding universal stress UspA family protein
MARAKSIIVAYDGSDAGRRALDAAVDQIGYGSTLAVVGIPSVRSPEPLSDASRYLSRRHVFARYVDGTGHPGESVLDEAVGIDADLIVVANLNGSSDMVIRGAACDVLVVR